MSIGNPNKIRGFIPIILFVIFIIIRAIKMTEPLKDSPDKPEIDSSDSSNHDTGFVHQFHRQPIVNFAWQRQSHFPLSQNRESGGTFSISADNRMTDSDVIVNHPEYAARRSTVTGYVFDIFVWSSTLHLPQENYFILQQIHQDFETFLHIRAITIARYLWNISGAMSSIEDILSIIAMHYVESFIPPSALPSNPNDIFPSEVLDLIYFPWEASRLLYRVFLELPDITPIPALIKAKRSGNPIPLKGVAILLSHALEAVRSINTASCVATDNLWKAIPEFRNDVIAFGKEMTYTTFDPIIEIEPRIPSFLHIQSLAKSFAFPFSFVHTFHSGDKVLYADTFSLYAFQHRILEILFNPIRFFHAHEAILDNLPNHLYDHLYIPYVDSLTNFPPSLNINETWLSYKTLEYELRTDAKLPKSYKQRTGELFPAFSIFPSLSQQTKDILAKKYAQSSSSGDDSKSVDQSDESGVIPPEGIDRFKAVYLSDEQFSLQPNDYKEFVNVPGYTLSFCDPSSFHPYGIDFSQLDGHGLDQTSVNSLGQVTYRDNIVQGVWNGQVLNHLGKPLSGAQIEIYELERQLFKLQCQHRLAQKEVFKRIRALIPLEILLQAKDFPFSAWSIIKGKELKSLTKDEGKEEIITSPFDLYYDQAVEEIITFAQTHLSNYFRPTFDEIVESSDGSDYDIAFVQQSPPPVAQPNDSNNPGNIGQAVDPSCNPGEDLDMVGVD